MMRCMFTTSPRWPVTLQEPTPAPESFTHRLVLRPLRRRDREEWASLRHRNAGWLQPWENTDPAEEQSLTHYNFASAVRRMNRTATSGQSLPWGIAKELPHGRDTVLIGQLVVSGIFLGSMRSAAIGYWVDQAHAGLGIVPRAVAMATDYCFETLRLHRMEINILPTNANSLRVVEKLGFRFEGVRERFLHINGHWRDHASYALTAEEVKHGGLWRKLAEESS